MYVCILLVCLSYPFLEPGSCGGLLSPLWEPKSRCLSFQLPPSFYMSSLVPHTLLICRKEDRQGKRGPTLSPRHHASPEPSGGERRRNPSKRRPLPRLYQALTHLLAPPHRQDTEHCLGVLLNRWQENKAALFVVSSAPPSSAAEASPNSNTFREATHYIPTPTAPEPAVPKPLSYPDCGFPLLVVPSAVTLE